MKLASDKNVSNIKLMDITNQNDLYHMLILLYNSIFEISNLYLIRAAVDVIFFRRQRS